MLKKEDQERGMRMKNKDLRECIVACSERTSFFEEPEFDDAIIGVTADDKVCYSYRLMKQVLMERNGISEEDASDQIQYDTMNSMSASYNPPIIVMDDIPAMDYQRRNKIVSVDKENVSETCKMCSLKDITQELFTAGKCCAFAGRNDLSDACDKAGRISEKCH